MLALNITNKKGIAIKIVSVEVGGILTEHSILKVCELNDSERGQLKKMALTRRVLSNACLLKAHSNVIGQIIMNNLPLISTPNCLSNYLCAVILDCEESLFNYLKPMLSALNVYAVRV
jgi:hypothetical protein